MSVFGVFIVVFFASALIASNDKALLCGRLKSGSQLLWAACAHHYKPPCMHLGLKGHLSARSHSPLLTSFESYDASLS